MAGATRAARSTRRDGHGRWLWRLVRPLLVWNPTNDRLRVGNDSSYCNDEPRQQAHLPQRRNMPFEVGGRRRNASGGGGFRPDAQIPLEANTIVCRTERASCALVALLVRFTAFVGQLFFACHDSIHSLPKAGSSPNVKDEPRRGLA